MKEQLILSPKNFEEARKFIKQNKDKEITFSTNDDELNRQLLEKEKFGTLLISLSQRKDFMKQRNSGFNQVLAKLAKKKDIVIGIDLDEIIEDNKYNKAKILARVRQNIALCSKNKLKMKFIGKKHNRNIYDLKSLGLVLGMPTWMTKEL